MFKYANEAFSNLHTFPEHTSYYWIKFGFVVILELNVFPEGILNVSFYHSINQKILSTDRKQTHFHHVYRSEMFINQCELNMYKPSEYIN